MLQQTEYSYQNVHFNEHILGYMYKSARLAISVYDLCASGWVWCGEQL